MSFLRNLSLTRLGSKNPALFLSLDWRGKVKPCAPAHFRKAAITFPRKHFTAEGAEFSEKVG
jgi:hypothetical protein